MQTLQKRKKKKTTDFLVRLYSTHTHTQQHAGDLPNSVLSISLSREWG